MAKSFIDDSLISEAEKDAEVSAVGGSDTGMKYAVAKSNFLNGTKER